MKWVIMQEVKTLRRIELEVDPLKDFVAHNVISKALSEGEGEKVSSESKVVDYYSEIEGDVVSITDFGTVKLLLVRYEDPIAGQLFVICTGEKYGKKKVLAAVKDWNVALESFEITKKLQPAFRSMMEAVAMAKGGSDVA